MRRSEMRASSEVLAYRMVAVHSHSQCCGNAMRVQIVWLR
jgi:hypothetical protein